MRVLVIIPAAGSGSRFGAGTPKQYLPLRGKPVLHRTIGRFTRVAEVARVIVAVAAERLEELRAEKRWPDVVRFVEGGATRQESVTRALSAASAEDFDVVAVHDAVRPFFTQVTFETLLSAAQQHGASLPALPVADTVHEVEGDRIVRLLDRSRLVAAQTPQCFRFALLRELLARAAAERLVFTDEAGLAIRYGHDVRVVPGDAQNFKITHPNDWEAAERVLDQWGEE